MIEPSSSGGPLGRGCHLHLSLSLIVELRTGGLAGVIGHDVEPLPSQLTLLGGEDALWPLLHPAARRCGPGTPARRLHLPTCRLAQVARARGLGAVDERRADRSGRRCIWRHETAAYRPDRSARDETAVAHVHLAAARDGAARDGAQSIVGLVRVTADRVPDDGGNQWSSEVIRARPRNCRSRT